MALVMRGLAIGRERSLVAGLDGTLEPGTITVVLGPNGCGKSTLLLTLAGLLAPRAGTVESDGIAVHQLSDAARSERIAWQGELPSADFGFRVAERLALVEAGSRSAGAALARLDLEALADRRLTELSAGERQRVELAALWLREAPLWLLDEPTSHLDLRHQVAWLERLHEERAAGRTIVAVLHDLTQAHAIADRALLLSADGTHRFGAADLLLHADPIASVFGTEVERLRGARGDALLPVYPAPPDSSEGPANVG